MIAPIPINENPSITTIRIINPMKRKFNFMFHKILAIGIRIRDSTIIDIMYVFVIQRI